MSYCRFSSDYCNCDLYIYEDITGSYAMHIASSRYIFDRTPLIPTKTVEDFINNHDYVKEALRTADVVDINLPYAGESFYFSKLSQVIEKVKELQALGYVVPSNIISSMEEEILNSE